MCLFIEPVKKKLKKSLKKVPVNSASKGATCVCVSLLLPILRSSYSIYLLPCNPWMVINNSSNRNADLTHFCPLISFHKEMVILKFHGFLGGFELHMFEGK